MKEFQIDLQSPDGPMALGFASGIPRVRADGRSRVVDAAIVDGTAHTLSLDSDERFVKGQMDTAAWPLLTARRVAVFCHPHTGAEAQNLCRQINDHWRGSDRWATRDGCHEKAALRPSCPCIWTFGIDARSNGIRPAPWAQQQAGRR